MEKSAPHIVIVAGEASGDAHAAHLVEEIKRLNPSVTFSGLGGEKMRKAGVELYEDMTRLAVVGFVEVLKHYSEFKKIFDRTLDEVRRRSPAVVILVDYPGFNLRLARELKPLGIRVIYYISPQVWAWKENRVKAIKANTDRMLVLFAFEKDFYARHGMDVDFIGHPLIDDVKTTVSKEESLKCFGLSPSAPLTVGLLPGSRNKEIERLLPVMLKTAELIARDRPGSQFIIFKAPTVDRRLFNECLGAVSLSIAVVEYDIYNGVAACDAGMVASGTATLETALLGTPMVVVYKTAFLTWLLARLMIKIDCIGLVNVVAGKKIVPECIQFDATPSRIAATLKAIYDNPSRIKEIKNELAQVRSRLGEPGASRRAAEVIVKELKEENFICPY